MATRSSARYSRNLPDLPPEGEDPRRRRADPFHRSLRTPRAPDSGERLGRLPRQREAHRDFQANPKLTRIVRLPSKRFTSQERLCHEIANELTKDVQPNGVSMSRRNISAYGPAACGRSTPETGPWSPAGAYTNTSHLGEEFRLLIGRHPTPSGAGD